jgi:hypothetical protein
MFTISLLLNSPSLPELLHPLLSGFTILLFPPLITS